MNYEVNKTKPDDIIFPNDSNMIISRINAQLAEFNPQGTLIAIGCKHGSVLIMDFMTKEIVRCFSVYEDFEFEVNSDVDQFYNFRKLNYAYLEDDFVLLQKPQDERDCAAEARKKVIQFEPKDKTKCKA